MFGGGVGQDIVSREYGSVNADICVDGEIGIEMKRAPTNSQTNTLRGQIDKYQRAFPHVSVVACGIKDMDGWRELKNDFGGGGKGAVSFIHKREERFDSA